MRDRDALAQALDGADVVYHLAAATGVGQSMYRIADYVEVNVQGTANLLDAVVNTRNRPRRLVLASSRAVYGEGAYRCAACGIVHPPVRSPAQLDAGRWEPPCPQCSGSLVAVPTPETRTPDPGSIYGVTKLAQEQLCLCTARAYGIGVTVLRFFNVYGPRQSRSNPYTGIITAFLNRLSAGQAPEVYEDGRMTRDFVHVSDIVAALGAAEAAAPEAAGIFNIGSGQVTAIVELAALLCRLTASRLAPQISAAARVGDIRHCTADNAAAGSAFGYAPVIDLAEGLGELVTDGAGIHPAADLTAARRELAQAGLLR